MKRHRGVNPKALSLIFRNSKRKGHHHHHHHGHHKSGKKKKSGKGKTKRDSKGKSSKKLSSAVNGGNNQCSPWNYKANTMNPSICGPTGGPGCNWSICQNSPITPLLPPGVPQISLASIVPQNPILRNIFDFQSTIGTIIIPIYTPKQQCPGAQYCNLFPAAMTVDLCAPISTSSGQTTLTALCPIAAGTQSINVPNVEAIFQLAKLSESCDINYFKTIIQQSLNDPQKILSIHKFGQGKLTWSQIQKDYLNVCPGTTNKKGLYQPKRRNMWKQIRTGIMFYLLKQKFLKTNRLYLMQMCINESNKFYYFVEHADTENPPEWVDGGDGRGKNYLGKLLTLICYHLRETSKTQNFITQTPQQNDVLNIQKLDAAFAKPAFNTFMETPNNQIINNYPLIPRNLGTYKKRT